MTIKSRKKTLCYSDEETKDLIENKMKHYSMLSGIDMSKIMESIILNEIDPDNPKCGIWKMICNFYPLER